MKQILKHTVFWLIVGFSVAIVCFFWIVFFKHSSIEERVMPIIRSFNPSSGDPSFWLSDALRPGDSPEEFLELLWEAMLSQSEEVSITGKYFMMKVICEREVPSYNLGISNESWIESLEGFLDAKLKKYPNVGSKDGDIAADMWTLYTSTKENKTIDAPTNNGEARE